MEQENFEKITIDTIGKEYAKLGSNPSTGEYSVFMAVATNALSEYVKHMESNGLRVLWILIENSKEATESIVLKAQAYLDNLEAVKKELHVDV